MCHFSFLDDQGSDDLKLEIDIMKSIGQQSNIIAMFGCNTISKPNYIVMELAQYGDLDRYLQKKLEKVY